MPKSNFENDDLSSFDESQPYRRKGSLMADVLHADADMIVVNKPPIVSLTAEFEGEPSVEVQLRRMGHLMAGEPITPIYYFDPTLSGLAVLPAILHPLAAGEQVGGGQFTQVCFALVRAHPLATSGQIEIPLRLHPRGEELYQAFPDGPIPAATQWRVRDTFVGMALLECTPNSAQPNQIRAHLPAAGMPLVVDPPHGGGQSLLLSSFKAGYRKSHRRPEYPIIDRPTLHVLRLIFDHPTTHQPLSFEAELPKDFRATLHQLDRFGRLPVS
jgi:23S rRNA-/tRNA-specific pseudouridylate synthase